MADVVTASNLPRQSHGPPGGLTPATTRPERDPQTKATAAAAHAVLVLAEQVAVVRVLLAGNAPSQRADAQPARQQ